MADDIPEFIFEQMYRRAPTEADRSRLLGVKTGLGLSARDELWPFILTLDYYSASTAAARCEILQIVKAIPDEARAAAKSIEEAAGKKVEDAVALAVEKGADKISRVMVERTGATADKVPATQRIWAYLAGAGLALAFICLGAGLAWLYIEAKIGVCREPPVRNQDGSVVCYAKSVSS